MHYIPTLNHKGVAVGEEKVQIVLVQGENRVLEKLLMENPLVHMTATYDIDEIENIPNPQFAVPDFLVVINTDDVDKRKAIINALILRNSGHQVFLSSSRDVNDLLTLLSDIYSSLTKIDDKTSPFRTEIFVTEVTNRVLGDISLIVKEFENKKY